MGWTETALTHDRPVTALDAIRAALGDEILPRVIAHARKPVSGGGHVIYAAVRAHNDPDTVWGLVLLASTGTSSRSGGRVLRTKAMDETQGPGDDEAPKRILDPLSDTENRYALEWRARCRANVKAAAAKRKTAAAVKPGARVKSAEPIRFSDDTKRDEFTYQGGSLFAAAGARYRISNWKRRKRRRARRLRLRPGLRDLRRARAAGADPRACPPGRRRGRGRAAAAAGGQGVARPAQRCPADAQLPWPREPERRPSPVSRTPMRSCAPGTR